LDERDKEKDLEMAKHIGKVHKLKKTTDDAKLLFSPDFLRTYIAMSKNFEPTISEELHELLINKYIEKRQEQQSIKNKGDKYTTTRSLLALIRLCQARVTYMLSLGPTPLFK
jgi:DNA replication licensing factor MCM7